jgi:hypothetical protein
MVSRPRPSGKRQTGTASKPVVLAQFQPAELTDAVVRRLAEKVRLTADAAHLRSDSCPLFGLSLNTSSASLQRSMLCTSNSWRSGPRPWSN